MLTDPAPSPPTDLGNTLAELRASIAAEGTRKGLAGTVAAAVLRLLEVLLALLAEFRAGTLAAAPERGADASAEGAEECADAGAERWDEAWPPVAAPAPDGSGDGGADGVVAKVRNWVLGFAGFATKDADESWPLVGAAAAARSGDAGANAGRAESGGAARSNRVPAPDRVEGRLFAPVIDPVSSQSGPPFERDGWSPACAGLTGKIRKIKEYQPPGPKPAAAGALPMMHAKPNRFVLLPNLKHRFRGGCLGLP